MDIFTTALTKVRATPIKPEKLRVKALRKDAAASKLTDDENHLEQHDIYFVEENAHKKSKSQQQNHSSHVEKDENHKAEKEPLEAQHSEIDSDDEGFEQGIIASESVITHKQEILHPKKQHDDLTDNEGDEEIKHLDIFI